MDETEDTTLTLPGTYVNLYDPDLTVVTDPQIAPDTRWLLYDLARCPEGPWVIAAAGRVEDERAEEDALTFTVEGMAGTECAVRVSLPSAPTFVSGEGSDVAIEWDAASKTALVRFSNQPAGVSVRISLT